MEVRPMGTQNPMVRRLCRLLDTASDESWQQGTYWYAAAHAAAVGLADDHGVSVECAAGVIAALSPRLPWSRNVASARRLFETGDCPVLGANKTKALRIARGERPADVLGGFKVRAFYACLLSPTAVAVAVDRHACDAALGVRGNDKSRKRTLESKRGYAAIADTYRAVADRYGLAPAQAQAIIWLEWRSRHGVAA